MKHRLDSSPKMLDRAGPWTPRIGRLAARCGYDINTTISNSTRIYLRSHGQVLGLVIIDKSASVMPARSRSAQMGVDCSGTQVLRVTRKFTTIHPRHSQDRMKRLVRN